MGTIGLGYGSEYQLLRALGHHRDKFFKILKEIIGFDGPIEWLDYPFSASSISLDGELCEIECFKNEPCYDSLNKDWDMFWPARKNKAQNWDGIFRIGSKWFFVEAKAYTDEMQTPYRKKHDNSERIITRSFQGAIDWLKADKSGEQWLRSPYYQLANRLAYCHFLRNHGIEAYIVDLFFLNGYEKPERSRNRIKESKSVCSVKEWEKAIKTELKDLGLNEDSLAGVVYNVFVDCLSL